jgi:hypothetical protein
MPTVAYCCSNCEGSLFLADVFASRSASEQPSGHRLSDIPNFHHLLNITLPYSNICCHFPDCHASILSGEPIDFFLFLSVEAVLGRPLQGRSAVSVFSTLKRFTHRLTLLVPVQMCTYARGIRA